MSQMIFIHINSVQHVFTFTGQVFYYDCREIKEQKLINKLFLPLTVQFKSYAITTFYRKIRSRRVATLKVT